MVSYSNILSSSPNFCNLSKFCCCAHLCPPITLLSHTSEFTHVLTSRVTHEIVHEAQHGIKARALKMVNGSSARVLEVARSKENPLEVIDEKSQNKHKGRADRDRPKKPIRREDELRRPGTT